MKTLLIRFFIENWQRKLISLMLAMIIWMVVSHSMTVSKVIPNIPVRVTHLPPDKTIEGMQVNGLLNKKISLTLMGHKTILDEISAKDLEVVIDAKDKAPEWIATITQKNLVSLNPIFDPNQMISKVIPTEMIIRQTKLITEKIPVLITQPIGEAPKGYEYLDIWPYQLSVTVHGPEEAVKRTKNRGVKLTFNLNDISAGELNLPSSNPSGEVSFLVPDAWKKVSIPLLSETPLEIDDPQAVALRIDFSKQDLLPIPFSIPVSIFFPPNYSHTLNPETYSLATNDFITKKNGIKILNFPLYAQGVSHQFLETVKDRIEMIVIASPKSERETLIWNTQFMYPNELEDNYVAKIMAQSNEDVYDVQPHQLEEYLRSRFRNYMSRFRLYTSDRQKLSLKIELQANAVSVIAKNLP